MHEQLLTAARPGRRPVSGHDDPAGELRVFAVQLRIDVTATVDLATWRAHLRRAMDELVVPHLVEGRPALVVFPESVGLPALALGARGASFRERAAAPVPPPSELPASLLEAMGELAAAYQPQIMACLQLFGEIDPRALLPLAATDTSVRAVSLVFSEIARDYGVYVVAGNAQPRYRESRERAEVATFGDPESNDGVAFVPVEPRVANATFLWAPHEVDPEAPSGERNLLFRNEKIPLTDMEHELLALAEGPDTGDAARRNAGWVEVEGFRVGFATSLPAFAYGYPFGDRPADLDPFADLRVSYAAAQDALGVDVMIQADANPGPWAAPVASGAWQPLEWMGSTWRAVADPTVRFTYNVTPMMTGNLLDLMFDGQSSITSREHRGVPTRFVGDQAPGPLDPAEYAVYAGDKAEFLAVAPWVVPDGDRDELMAVTAALAPGSGSPIENGYVETAIYADLRRSTTPRVTS
ncbi:hypothetical protein [Homoserinibacter sp. GY 40078]|uniref:hypothetical protein n=1 Tax=Homoserinibacter sp. GY 40078 TaxID=2603275 RepID=UPI0016506843|nr:hypothetical protein [Homoserinibacter sp. GY 40078]